MSHNVMHFVLAIKLTAKCCEKRKSAGMVTGQYNEIIFTLGWIRVSKLASKKDLFPVLYYKC